MTLCSEMNDAVDLIFCEHLTDTLIVADIFTYEEVVRCLLDVLEIGEIACVGQFVQIDDAVVGVLIHHQTDDV